LPGLRFPPAVFLFKKFTKILFLFFPPPFILSLPPLFPLWGRCLLGPNLVVRQLLSGSSVGGRDDFLYVLTDPVLDLERKIFPIYIEERLFPFLLSLLFPAGKFVDHFLFPPWVFSLPYGETLPPPPLSPHPPFFLLPSLPGMKGRGKIVRSPLLFFSFLSFHSPPLRSQRN